MLLKLIGYEMKAFGRIMLPLYAALLGFALLTGLSIQFLRASRHPDLHALRHPDDVDHHHDLRAVRDPLL